MKLQWVLKYAGCMAIGWLLACSPPPEKQAVGNAIMKPCPGFVETGKSPLVYGAECGELKVHENRADPASKEITLAILRLPAISPVAEKDPLFLIQGGPGGSSIDMANQIHYFFADVRKNRDLIFVDQRGTGKSHPLACERLKPEDLLLPEAEQIEKYRHAMQACAEKYREGAEFYTTVHAVADVEAVRVALGYPAINVWGGSYGTRVALEYARRYPQQTRALVLDGVAPVTIALPKYFARDAMSALRAINNTCLAQADCAAEFGDIVQKAEVILERLVQREERGEVLTVSYEHPRNHQQERFNLTPRTFASLLFMSLYSRDFTVLLPQAISKGEQEDYRLLATLWALSGEQLELMNIAEGMRYSVLCNEDWPQIAQDKRAQGDTFFRYSFMKDVEGICAFWPKAQLPEDYWQPIKSDVPVLLLSGQQDPVTPDVWAEEVAQYLPNATLLTAPGGNHSISAEGCVPQLIAQFIERASMQGINVECVENIKPLPFVLGANKKKEPSANEEAESLSSGSDEL